VFNIHTSVIGTTGSGKSYALNRIIYRESCGTLYFNTNLLKKEIRPGWIVADKNVYPSQIIKALKVGKKINYMPDPDTFQEELIYLVDKLFKAGFTEDHFFIFAIDESHLFKKMADEKQVKIATSGRTFGFKGVFISQRPAEMNYTLLSQSSEFFIFDINDFDYSYLKDKKFPVDQIREELKKHGEYGYCFYNGHELQGFSKVNS
jgi:hypothetical protein